MKETPAQVRVRAAAPRIERASDDLCLVFPGGRVVGFREYGDRDGLPVICFHGTPGSRFMFQLADEFSRSAGLRLIAPERPGYGMSTLLKHRALADTALDMDALADALGLARFAVAGVSGGGPFAVACAALLRERVLAMALVSPVGPMAGPECPSSIGTGHYLAFRVLPDLPLLYRGLFSVGRLAFHYAPGLIYGFILSRSAPSDWPILSRGEVRRNLIRGIREGVRPGVSGALEEMRIFARPWNIPFQAIRCRSVLWQGTADRNVSARAAFHLGTLIPRCDIRRLEGAGHYWILQNYEEVLATVAELARAPATGRP